MAEKDPSKKSLGEIIETTVVAHGDAAVKALAPLGRVAEAIAFQVLTISGIAVMAYIAVWGVQSGAYELGGIASFGAVGLLLKEVEYRGDISKFWQEAGTVRR